MATNARTALGGRPRSYPVCFLPDDLGIAFNLLIYDEKYRVVATAETSDPGADALVAPAWTGTFYFRVVAARGSGGYGLYLRLDAIPSIKTQPEFP